MAKRRADAWGIPVHTGTLHSPQVDQQLRYLYLPDLPAILVSDHLDLPGQWIALEVALVHARLGHRSQPDRNRWLRQQDQALRLALEQRVPLEQLVRGELRRWTPARLAEELGVPEWAVAWRVEHLEPWEAAKVQIRLAG